VSVKKQLQTQPDWYLIASNGG